MARSVASTVGTSVVGAGVSLAREVPGTVAVVTGIAAFGSWLYLSRNTKAMRQPKRQSRIAKQCRKQIQTGANPLEMQHSPSAAAQRPTSALSSEDDFDEFADAQSVSEDDAEEGYLMVTADTDMQSVDSSDPDGTPEARAEAVFTHVLNRNVEAAVAALDEGVVDINS